jgi:hypothetical protein
MAFDRSNTQHHAIELLCETIRYWRSRGVVVDFGEVAAHKYGGAALRQPTPLLEVRSRGRSMVRQSVRLARSHAADALRRQRTAHRRQRCGDHGVMSQVMWVTGGYPWDGDPVGGIFFQTQARALAGLGVSVAVVSPTPVVPWPLARLRARWQLYSMEPHLMRDDGVLSPAAFSTSPVGRVGLFLIARSRVRSGDPGAPDRRPRFMAITPSRPCGVAHCTAN